MGYPGRYCYHIQADIAIMLTSGNIILLALAGISLGQDCGVGSKCRTLGGVNTCTSCPQNTVCIQQTTDSDFFCQYSFCLPQSMICGGTLGTCCSGLKCGLATLNDPYMSCQPDNSTASSTTSSSATTTGSATTTPAIIIVTATTASAGQCLTDGGAKVGLPCVFPFTNKGVTYTSCTTDGGFDKPWCSTATDIFGNHVLGNWGDCNPACLSQQSSTTPSTSSTCTTVNGPAAGSKCVFPFKYKGEVHTASTYAGGFSKPWCSTKVDYWGRHDEEYWGNCDTNTCKVEGIWN